MILMIDNYDSFTYNLVQYLGELGQELDVVRNDKITVEQARKRRPSAIVIAPVIKFSSSPHFPATARISDDVMIVSKPPETVST